MFFPRDLVNARLEGTVYLLVSWSSTDLMLALCADLDALHSDTALDIPWHVRQYLQKYERCTDDRKLLANMETQIIVLRAIGAPLAALPLEA